MADEDLHHSQGVDVAEVRRRMGESNDVDPRDLPPGWLLHVHERLDEIHRVLSAHKSEVAAAVSASVTAAIAPAIDRIERSVGAVEHRVKLVEHRQDDHERRTGETLAEHSKRLLELELGRAKKSTRRKSPTKGKRK